MRRRERECNNKDSDVGCEEDKCIGESTVGLRSFGFEERERERTVVIKPFLFMFPTWGLIASGIKEMCLFWS